MPEATTNEANIGGAANPHENYDLSAGMFRAAERVEETYLQMYREKYQTLVNVRVKFGDVGGFGFYEGDILLGTTKEVSGVDDPGALGIGIPGEEYRWPDGRVPYETEEIVRPRVEAAIAHWMEKTPFEFVRRTNEEDYLSFARRNGCWSKVGRHGGPQMVSLGLGCGVGAAIHEIGHALGLWHEQSRSDRDEYIEILWENIADDMEYNFDKHVLDGTDLGEYDFRSIMHYPETAFSINGKPTIKPINGQSIGQRDGLSPGDISAMKTMYPKLNWK
jgi:Astacin (Peptidase family M12A)